MYNGLTAADKMVMLKAMKFGAKWLARDWTGQLYGYSVKPRKDDEFKKWTSSGGYMFLVKDKYIRLADWSDTEPVNIDLALAQIAKMDSKENKLLSEKASEKPCMTWNERINQMTVEEKADVALNLNLCAGELRKPYDLCDEKYLYASGMQHNGRFHDCRQCWIDKLNSPYTEGETK